MGCVGARIGREARRDLGGWHDEGGWTQPWQAIIHTDLRSRELRSTSLFTYSPFTSLWLRLRFVAER